MLSLTYSLGYFGDRGENFDERVCVCGWMIGL